MTPSDAVVNTLTAPADTAPHDLRQPRRRRALRGVLALAALLLVAAAVWMWRHPDRSFESSYGVETERAVGETMWTPLEQGNYAAPGTIHIENIEPRLESDGAAAVVEYAVCDLDPATLAAERVVGSPFGGHDREVDRYCTRVVPAEGASLRLGTNPGSELLVGVTATRPGRTVVRSHRIEFTEGWQEGHEDIDVEVVLNAH